MKLWNYSRKNGGENDAYHELINSKDMGTQIIWGLVFTSIIVPTSVDVSAEDLFVGIHYFDKCPQLMIHHSRGTITNSMFPFHLPNN